MFAYIKRSISNIVSVCSMACSCCPQLLPIFSHLGTLAPGALPAPPAAADKLAAPPPVTAAAAARTALLPAACDAPLLPAALGAVLSSAAAEGSTSGGTSCCSSASTSGCSTGPAPCPAPPHLSGLNPTWMWAAGTSCASYRVAPRSLSFSNTLGGVVYRYSPGRSPGRVTAAASAWQQEVVVVVVVVVVVGGGVYGNRNSAPVAHATPVWHQP